MCRPMPASKLASAGQSAPPSNNFGTAQMSLKHWGSGPTTKFWIFSRQPHMNFSTPLCYDYSGGSFTLLYSPFCLRTQPAFPFYLDFVTIYGCRPLFRCSGAGRSTSDLKWNTSGFVHHATAGRSNSDLKWKYVGHCASRFYQEATRSERHPKLVLGPYVNIRHSR